MAVDDWRVFAIAFGIMCAALDVSQFIETRKQSISALWLIVGVLVIGVSLHFAKAWWHE